MNETNNREVADAVDFTSTSVGTDAADERAALRPIGPRETASAARVYDFWLDGKDSLAVDRRVGRAVAELLPWIPMAARANRRFLARAVWHLAGQGVRQFLDVGAGLPTRPNVHEVAQRVHADSRVVYVDNDPGVAARGRALLAEDARTVMVEGDARDPAGILADPAVTRHLDWSQPVGVLLVAVLHFVTDEDEPRRTVAAFRDVMATGSAVAISHATPGPPETADAMSAAVAAYEELAVPIVPRSPDEVGRFFDGFQLIRPGLVRVDRWRVKGKQVRWGRPAWSASGANVAAASDIRAVAGVGLVVGEPGGGDR